MFGSDEPRPVVPVTVHMCREVSERADPVPPRAVQRLVDDHPLLGLHVTGNQDDLVVVALEVSIPPGCHVEAHAPMLGLAARCDAVDRERHAAPAVRESVRYGV